MKLLILDHSVISYKAFLKLFKQDYSGETSDELHEFTRQYISEVAYLNALHNPDAVLWVLDCPRADIWRHKVCRSYYGPLLSLYPHEWVPGTEDRTPENACAWYGETDGKYRSIWLDAEGGFKDKHMTKANFTKWVEKCTENETGIQICESRPFLKSILKHAAPMYKGNREGQHWPASAVLDRDTFKETAVKIAHTIASHFNGKIAYADNIEADDLAYAATVKYGEKHEIIVATTDKDWEQLRLFCNDLKFWDMNAHAFASSQYAVISEAMYTKLMTGDSSDNVKSMRLKGKTGGIGAKKAADLLKAVGPKFGQWLRENGDPASMKRNYDLMHLGKIYEPFKTRAADAIKNAVKPEQACELEELISESSLSLAIADGQKQRQALQIMEGK